MKRRTRAGLLALPALVYVTACTTVPPAPELGPPLAGRLAVRVQATSERAAASHSAAFEWRGNGARGELRLFTPLGTQVALARWSAGDVRLLSSEGEARFATLEDLSRQVLGEALPLAALGDWLRGRPWPEVPAEPLPGGSFRQLGWEIVLSRRDDGHIRFTRAAPPQVTVRVVLDPAERAP